MQATHRLKKGTALYVHSNVKCSQDFHNNNNNKNEVLVKKHGKKTIYIQLLL